MSLEELQQLLLRSHQQGAVEAGASAVVDVSNLSEFRLVETKYGRQIGSLVQVSPTLMAPTTPTLMFLSWSPPIQPFGLSLPLTEWNFTEMESNLKSVSQPKDGCCWYSGRQPNLNPSGS